MVNAKWAVGVAYSYPAISFNCDFISLEVSLDEYKI